MSARAGVSEDVFYCLFPTVEGCYHAAYEQGLDRLSGVVAEAAEREQGWLDRVRAGLVALLGFFDDEPSWARMLVLGAQAGGALTVECRQRLHDVLAQLLDHDGGAAVAAGTPVPSAALTGELVAGGVFSVIHTSLLEDPASKVVELAPSLMTFIAASYLGQASAPGAGRGKPSNGSVALAGEPEPARARAISRATELPIRATYRTTLVLRAIAQAPYSNNREIAQAAGLTDEGQTSKLLARLERQGVIENVGAGPARGEPNAWLLTPCGRRTVELLGDAAPLGASSSRCARVRGTA